MVTIMDVVMGTGCAAAHESKVDVAEPQAHSQYHLQVTARRRLEACESMPQARHVGAPDCHNVSHNPEPPNPKPLNPKTLKPKP